MVIKITEKCSMNCSHCMNNALPSGKHMSFDTFKEVIAFQQQYGTMFCILSGGEPTEHPEFENFLIYAIDTLPYCIVTVTTNGVWMQDNYDFVKHVWEKYDKHVMFQVTSVPEYYPELIDTTLPVFKLPNVIVCDKIEAMYPQGRALTNNLPWKSNGSKCVNIRLMAHQVGFRGLRGMLNVMAAHGFFCTPHITISGDIKLGESDLCPAASNIYKEEHEIIDDILNFRCHQCDFINKKLAPQVQAILGEQYEV